MNEAPLGDWAALLIGHQWPGSESLTITAAAAASRQSSGSELERYADSLRSALSGPLAVQEGATAEDTRESFHIGEKHALTLAEKSYVKGNSYDSAHQYVSSFRSELTSIAAEGSAQIKQTLSSNTPDPIKFNKLVDIVIEAQTRANTKAASHIDNILAAVQRVLTEEELSTSAREFAKANGMDLDNDRNRPNEGAIRDRVAALTNIKDPLSKGPPLAPPATGQSAEQGPSSLDALGQHSAASPGQSPVSTAAAGASPIQAAAGKSAANLAPSSSSSSQNAQLPSSLNSVAEAALPSPGQGYTTSTSGSPPTPSATVGGPAGVAPPGLSQSVSNAAVTQSGVHSLPSAPTNALSPEGFAQNFNAGNQAGTPMSAGTEALSNTAAHAMQPQAPIHPEGMAPPPMASTTPSAAAPLFETAHAAPTFDTPPPAAPPADAAPQTVMAAPTAAAPAMPSTAAPAAPAGPLPAYGSDLRPPAATAPASPAPMPSAAAPGSAPVQPSNANPLNQPTVVRQQPTPAPTTATPAGLTENAVAATATGAMAGASAAQTQAQQRLQRLLDAVARQEPKLRWAIADRDDGTTVLTTDLASGWIPPHVEIPTGITLLTPNRRSRTLGALLGETTLTAAYHPGQYIPPAEDTEPVSMSIRARQTADVDELGWELSQATKWRDGLPRLAHTLAKAASAGTGYLDSEVDLLREHLGTVARQVITGYPDVDSAQVGNWQLLATIDALIKNEKTAANYHFAWFQALSLALKGEERR